MTGSGVPAPVTFASIREEFGRDGWQVGWGTFCWPAVRRPAATAVEVITGEDLDHLAAKLRAERDGTPG
jgi:hypothetical protein